MPPNNSRNPAATRIERRPVEPVGVDETGAIQHGRIEGVAGELMEIRKPQFLEGKMTMLGIVLTVLSTLAGFAGVVLPAEDIKAFAKWTSENWPALTAGAGILMTAYGKLRRNWRK